MPEENSNTQPAPVSAESAPPATQGDHMIPKARLDEVLAQNRNLADRLAAIETERKTELDKRLEEQNQFKELAERRGAELAEAQKKAAMVDEYEKTLLDLLSKQVESIPEEKRGL